jgi:hypothetical protein
VAITRVPSLLASTVIMLPPFSGQRMKRFG